MRSFVNPFIVVFLSSLSFVLSHSLNLVQNVDVAANGDGPNGYAFSPRGLAMDNSGNIFFTESTSIRMSNSSGVLTVSGTNTVPPGLFNGTSGIAVDSRGNLIVADSLNNRIKNIDLNGRISVLGTTGMVFSQITSRVSTFASGFFKPGNIAFDSNSNFYVGDSNNLVYKVFPNGTVLPLASISNPRGMAVDSFGNLYVGSITTHNVYKITPTGSVSLLAGSGSATFADGTGASASFNYPFVGAVDGSGNVYVADRHNSRIRKITSAGVVVTIAGSGAYSSLDGQGASASFMEPNDVKIDSLGNLIVVDTVSCKVRMISVSGYVSTIAGSTCSSIDGQSTSAGFSYPSSLVFDSNGNIYVTDWGSSEIRMINSSMYVSTVTGSSGTGYVDGNLLVAQFSNPLGVAMDPKTGNLYVPDWGNNVVRKITLSGAKNMYSLPFNSPTGVAVDSLGNVFVADQMNHMIKFIDTTGVVNILAGSGNASFSDGNGVYSSFNSPYGIALDLYGNAIVADTRNNMIRNVSRSGIVSTIAGNGTAGWVDGQGTSSALSSPMGVTVDASNRVFISDSANNCIRVINGTGYVNTLLFGRGRNIGLNAPQGILVSPNGDLYIADTGNKRIRTVPASMLVGII